MSKDGPTIEAVGDSNADIVCLQETDANWERALRARYSEQYPYMVFKVDEGPRGLAVLSRYPLEDALLLKAPHDFHPALRVFAITPMGRVQLLNLHLRSLFDGATNPVSDYFSTSKDHVSEIREFYSHCTDDPTVVLGDFNESPDGRAVGWLEERGFQNALPLYHPGQPTWRGRSVGGQFELTIDHVLFDAAFEPLNAYVGEPGNSDHLPVVLHVEAGQRS